MSSQSYPLSSLERMAQLRAGPPGNPSPIARALGEDFRKLHVAVRKHYSESTVDVIGVMDRVHVKTPIKPLALLSYKLFRAPVPRGGENVEFTVHSRVDGSGAMHWRRSFFSNASFPRDVTFASHMVFLGDHRIVETTRFGLGVESSLIVDDSGSLVYDIRNYTISMPFLGLIVRFPAWLSPFGGGRTTESGENEDSFRVEFDMTHPIFGRTVGYTGSCRIT